MSNSNLYMKAKKVTSQPRKSHTFGEGRICKDTFCKQVMSKYNHNEYCFIHAPAKIPRTRGHTIR